MTTKTPDAPLLILPGAVDLPPPRGVAVADAVQEIVKALKALRLYERTNRMLEGRLRILALKLLPLVQEEGRVRLEIYPTEIRFEGEPVYADVNRETSLAARLYREGLRSLTLTDRLVESALTDLLEILNTEVKEDEQIEDDIVTLLWARDIAGVEYELAEQVMAGQGSDGPGLSEFLESANPAESWDTGDADGGSPGHVSPADLDGLKRPESLPSEGIRLSEAELGVLQAEIQRDRERDLLLDLQDVLFEAVLQTREESERTRLVSVAGQVLSALLDARQDGRLLHVVMRLVLLDQLYFAGVDRVAGLTEQLRTTLGSARGVAALRRVADASPNNEAELQMVLDWLPDEAMLHALKLACSARLRRVRRLLVDAVVRRGESWLPAVAKAMESAPGPAARDLLDAAADAAGSTLVLRMGLHHGDPHIRRVALQRLVAQRAAESREAAAALLEDTEPQVRVAALAALMTVGGEPEAELVRTVIDGASFGKRPDAERAALLMTYGALAGDGAVAMLKRILLKRNLLGLESRRDEARHAAEALAAIGTQAAREALGQGASGASGPLRDVCADLLAGLDREKAL